MGSEMCIRDRSMIGTPTPPVTGGYIGIACGGSDVNQLGRLGICLTSLIIMLVDLT